MVIDGHDYRLLKDYDTGNYKHLTFDGRVTYLDARVERILITPCREAMKTPGNDLGLVLATAVCAAISAASTFYKGQRAKKTGEDKEFFTDFVTHYMRLAQQRSNPGASWVEWLYKDVRCGLAHNFTIMSGGIEYEISSYTALKNYGPEINPQGLLEDFAGGWSRYLADVRTDGPAKELGKKFDKRFNEVFRD